jgi:predicted adenine nucleotide alpha hydrolase (AANH) superfamily ATPase
MAGNGFSPVLFFFNPNIFPAGEYIRRREECRCYAQSLGVEFVEGDDDHGRWLEQVAGLESEPERGERCVRCFRIRLTETARLAMRMDIPLFTTTLAGSRWKNFEQIVEAGRRAERSVEGGRFWDRDWKKGGLTERRKILLQENGFYNQSYCGCEFSIKH